MILLKFFILFIFTLLTSSHMAYSKGSIAVDSASNQKSAQEGKLRQESESRTQKILQSLSDQQKETASKTIQSEVLDSTTSRLTENKIKLAKFWKNDSAEEAAFKKIILLLSKSKTSQDEVNSSQLEIILSYLTLGPSFMVKPTMVVEAIEFWTPIEQNALTTRFRESESIRTDNADTAYQQRLGSQLGEYCAACGC